MAEASNSVWDYKKYYEGLKKEGTDFNAEFSKLDPVMGPNAKNLYREILDQQKAGSSEFWYAGNAASKEAAAADFALRLAENGVGSLNEIGQLTIPGDGEQQAQQITINKVTGQPLPRQDLLGRGNRDLDVDYNLSFTADGQVIPYTSNRESGWMSFRENALKPAAQFALAYFGAPMVGAAVAPGVAAATQGAIGGALVGGGTAAATGGNVLQGALLGGAGGYLQGANAVPAQDSIYSLATGTPNLASMGGGQGLLSTGASNLASMGGGQGLQILAGLPSASLAEALSTFGGVNPSALSSMGLGSGISYVTPTGIVTENGTTIGGDMIGELGKNTGFNLPDWLNKNVGAGIGDELAKVNTGINAPATGSTGLTNSQIANLAKAGLSLAGGAGAARALGGGTNAPFQAPTQGMAEYTPEYYQQLQQYYNAYLPQTPRDVVSPLQQWYSQTYSGGNMQQPQQPSGTATGTMQATPAAPAAPMAPVTPATPTGLFTTGMGSSPARTGPQEPLNSMNLPVAGPSQAERDAALARQNAELEARKARRAAFEQSGLPGQFTVSGYAPGQGTYSIETGQAEQPYVYANGMFSRAPSNVSVAAQPPAPTPAPQDNWMSNLAVDPNAAPANFDWQKYVAINTDLQTAGVDTPTEALRHYLYYGKQENRRLS